MSAGLSPEERAAILARCYDLDTIDVSYDAELYLSLAHEASGDILELGVGSGRLAIPLALAGHRVVGVDDDPAMLERARIRWERTRGRQDADRLDLRQADFRTYRSEERFGLAFLAVNTFLLAEDDEAREAILSTMRHHLAPGGIAAVELSTPDDEELARYDGRVHLEWSRTDPETGDEVSKSIAARHDAEAGTVELVQVYEWTAPGGGALSRVVKSDLLHLVAADHLGDLASNVGLGNVELRGDHLLTPYGAGSHRVILVGRLV